MPPLPLSWKVKGLPFTAGTELALEMPMTLTVMVSDNWAVLWVGAAAVGDGDRDVADAGRRGRAADRAEGGVQAQAGGKGARGHGIRVGTGAAGRRDSVIEETSLDPARGGGARDAERGEDAEVEVELGRVGRGGIVADRERDPGVALEPVGVLPMRPVEAFKLRPAWAVVPLVTL